MSDSMQIVDRLLDIIEQLCQANAPVGPTYLAEKTGLHKSTVYRLLSALHSRGYVEKNETDGTYFLGAKMISLVGYYIDGLELIAEARPYLADLSAEFNLTAHLGLLDKTEVVYVEKLDALPSKRLDSQIGYRVPAYCSSLGKCLLAALSADELAEIFTTADLIKYTVNTISTLAELKQHLRLVRSQGWAMDDQEFELGHRCIAAPVYDYRGEVIAAISVSGSLERLTDAVSPKIRAAVIATAAKISKRLCYGG